MSCVFIFNLKFEIVQTVTFHFRYFNVYSIQSVFPSRLLFFYSYPLQTPQAFLHFFNMNLGFFWHSPAEDHCPQSPSRSSHTSTPSPYESNRYFLKNGLNTQFLTYFWRATGSPILPVQSLFSQDCFCRHLEQAGPLV